MCRDLGDREGSARLLSFLGAVTTQRGDYARAAALLEESLGLCDALGNKRLGSAAHVWLGIVARYQNDHGRAAAFVEKGLAYAKEAGDKWRIARALRILGILALHRGECEQAAAFYKESLTLSREVGDRQGTEEGLEGLAGVASAGGYYDQAVILFGAAEALRIALGLHRPPLDQADYERRVASTRAALEPTVFEAAWARGTEMPPEQAVDYALAWSEPEQPAKPRQPGREPKGDPLTGREHEVAALVARGRTNREIAAALVISERTADAHVRNILDKLGFSSRAQIAAWAAEHGLRSDLGA